ncbi:protein NRT1/ PTR FAMILY 1.2 [Quillaja saponaria]|uniref:Protein NRT1/ PTR FAMILY 1.2 n=1 Tax=Quillaja saponaria TaxID=32244 RepID=A0AAD7PS64_QUISA|nr:protein NRT1/ PTR FAMILY 1.2 [Quillaja saponaria]
MQSPSLSEQTDSTMIEEPLLNNNTAKGGFRTLPFIIVNEAFEKLASYCLTPNMILYLTKEYGMQNVAATNLILLWSAASNFTPILGAFLSDSYVGRYWMIGFGSIASLLGMSLLWLTTMIPRSRAPCHESAESCSSPTAIELLVLYSSFALMSLGAGGVRSSSLAFGADQLRKRGKDGGIYESYLNWYYAASAAAVLIGMTLMVYIQDKMGWKVGFGIPVVLMFISAASFFLASRFYIKIKGKTNLFSGIAQVPVAAYRNRQVPLSSQVTYDLYHHERESTCLMPSDNLRFLNKACIIKNPQQDLTPEGRASDPWSLCSVDKVEEFKALIRIVPIWTTGIMLAVNLSQSSFLVLEASSMDRHISSGFEIPAGYFGTFMIVFIILWIALYERVIVPLASKVRGRKTHLDVKQKMGVGLVSSCIAIASLAVVESFRRKLAIEEGFSDDPKAVVNMSALWLLPRQIFDGLAEAANRVGQNEFYLSELPQSMSSIASSLSGLGMSVANLVASLMLSIVDNVTEREGEVSWLSNNINKGHYDYYYWLICSLSLLNYMYFLYCSKAYGPCKGEKEKGSDEEG